MALEFQASVAAATCVEMSITAHSNGSALAAALEQHSIGITNAKGNVSHQIDSQIIITFVNADTIVAAATFKVIHITDCQRIVTFVITHHTATSIEACGAGNLSAAHINLSGTGTHSHHGNRH